MKRSTKHARQPQGNTEYSLRSESNTRTSIARRTLLRGTGAALALPWLEAMRPLPTASASEIPNPHPKRIAALFVPNGVRQDCWTPAAEGSEFELTSTLEPLQPVKDQLLVLTSHPRHQPPQTSSDSQLLLYRTHLRLSARPVMVLQG